MDQSGKRLVPKWIVESLTPEQLDAFGDSSKHACVVASAGSGKTRTLVHMLAADLAGGVPPHSIVAFTFTEKAAAELLARVHKTCRERLPGVSLDGLFIGTIHAWCLKFLRQQPAYYGFDPLDELQLDALVGRLYDGIGIHAAYQLPFPRGIRPFVKDLDVYYNEQLRLADVPVAIKSCISIFVEMLRTNRLLTFGGMIRHTIEHLKEQGPESTLARLYVDEYQDVNPAQVGLIKAMLPATARLVAVGDDLQCIYNWRGSDVSRILRFADDFPSSQVHYLTTNFRSRPAIVTAANCFASHITSRDHGKVMTPSRPPDAGVAVASLTVAGEAAQADAIARIVRKLVERGASPSGIAILLRSVRSSGQAVVAALEAVGLPVDCPTLGRGVRFTKDFLQPVIAWLAAEKNEPRNTQEERAQEEAAAALEGSVQPWLGSTCTLGQFWSALNEWESRVARQSNDAYDVRGRLFDFLGACRLQISHGDSDLAIGIGIASQIIRSVEEVHRRRLAGQTRRRPRGVLREVLAAFGSYEDRFGESAPIESQAAGVTVSTVHQTKGLEWPIVIVAMLASRRFPLASSSHGTSYDRRVAGRYGTSLEDERRLFYVAMTRARERLLLVDPCEDAPTRRSKFVVELRSAGVATPTRDQLLAGAFLAVSPSDWEVSNTPPLRIGLSDLLLYLECPYQYALRRVASVQASVSDELGYGRGLHDLVRRRLESQAAWSGATCAAEALAHVHLPLASASSEAQSRAAIVERLMLLQRLGAFSTEVDTEVEVNLSFPEGVVTGIIDLVELHPDGSVGIRDWKANIHPGFLPRYTKQIQSYVFALSQAGRQVSVAELVDVGASMRTQQLSVTRIPVDTDSLRSLGNALEAALRSIRSRTFAPAPTPETCDACDMNRICAHRASSNE